MKISLVDMAKIILACAFASACITPGHRVAQADGRQSWDILMVDTMIVPLVLALFAFAAARRGSRRDTLIDVLLAWTVAVPLGYITWGIAWFVLLQVRLQRIPRVGLRRTTGVRGGRTWEQDLVVVLVWTALAALFGFLLYRIIRRVRTTHFAGTRNGPRVESPLPSVLKADSA